MRTGGDESGQAITEYIVLLSIVMFGWIGMYRVLKGVRVGERIVAPLQASYAATYQYGSPKAKGYDEGEPEGHPRATGGKDNFRIFFNPERK